ncbi:MAG: response regulator [Patescibacteria group bacterium]
MKTVRRAIEKTILIIEDDTVLLWALAKTLTKEGFVVHKATDGEAGLELAIREHPDLVLLDIIMPKMDGITVLKKLRADLWGKKVPVIVLTNLSVADTAAEIGNKYEDYLIKAEWKLTDVVKKVKERLKIK